MWSVDLYLLLSLDCLGLNSRLDFYLRKYSTYKIVEGLPSGTYCVPIQTDEIAKLLTMVVSFNNFCNIRSINEPSLVITVSQVIGKHLESLRIFGYVHAYIFSVWFD